MNDAVNLLRELDVHEVDHCIAPFTESAAVAITQLETLPFHDLGGSGLERLCFELLLARGQEPRFFGRSGQAQYGVDLVVENEGRTEVYQCKNLAAPPSSTDLSGYLAKFEKEWLGEAGLPRPTRFVICCPQPMRDSATDAAWILERTAFRKRTGVEADLWHLALLKRWLRDLPDVVADLFSNRHAEGFCEQYEWSSDLFKPVREGASGDRRLKRYFASKRRSRLYVDEGRKRAILGALDRSQVVLVQGLPGTGKTFTTLAVAESLREGRSRVYFVDVGTEEFSVAALKNGIRARMARPSTFVLENCHDKVEALAQALADLEPELASKRATILALARRRPGPLDARSDDSDFYAELDLRQAIVGFENDDETLKRVAEFWRPDLAGIDGPRLSKLVVLCGRDLYLLDEVLALAGSAAEIDTISTSDVFELVRGAYLGYKTADDFPATRRLAALTQFEVYPRADVLRLQDDEAERLEGFCLRASQPPRWHFLHSSAAELILHALWSGMGVSDAAEVASWAATDIVDYFRDAQRPDLRPPVVPSALEADLLQVLNNHLKLATPDAEGRLKAAVLDSEPVRQLLSTLQTSTTYPSIVLRCAEIAHLTGAATAGAYADQLLDAFRAVCDREEPVGDLMTFHLTVRLLGTLERIAPAHHASLDRKTVLRHLLGLLAANGNLMDVARLTLRAPVPLARDLVEGLEEEQIERLTTRTIEMQRSVGTVGVKHRELRRLEERADIADMVERRIGAQRFLRVIEANGTLFELFRIIEYVSPVLAGEIVAALDEPRVERLVDKTIASGRSVGTLHLTLRELLVREATTDIAHELERRIGGFHFLRLVDANGTILELFKILEYVSPALARGIVAALDEPRVERLVDKTIASGRSIGTLHLALRDLLTAEATSDVARELQRRIGISRFLRLVDANGTIYELFRLIHDGSPDFAREVVEALDDDRIERLVDKTISSSRSIGTLNLTLRNLRGRNETSEIGRELERRIGVPRFLRLIESNGTLFELFRIVEHSSAAFARELVNAVDEASIERLLDKTIRTRRSIATFHYALRARNRKEGGAAIARALESKIGPDRFWRLIVGTGTAGALVDIVENVGPAFRRSLARAARALTIEDWSTILDHGDVLDLGKLISRGGDLLQDSICEQRLRDAIAERILHLLERSTWYQLNSCARLLTNAPESSLREMVSAAIRTFLANVQLQTLPSRDLHQIVNAIEALHRDRPDLRGLLAAEVCRLVPDPTAWRIRPKEETGDLRTLLRVLSKADFSSGDALHLVDAVMNTLTRRFVEDCTTADLVWIVWSLVEIRRRPDQDGKPFDRIPSLELMRTLHDTLLARVRKDGDRDEWRARFALAGALSLVDGSLDPTIGAALRSAVERNGEAAAWWLCADQSFVFAGLILRAIELVRPMAPKQWAGFRRRLASAASELPVIDGATAFLHEKLLPAD